jgi:hypothetical protein
MNQRSATKATVLLLSVFLGATMAQTTSDPPNPPETQESGSTGAKTVQPRAYLVPNDVSFAHIAVGGVWRTAFYITNMSGSRIPYTLSFYDDNGNAMSVPVLGANGTYVPMTSYSNTISAFGEQNFDVANYNPNVQTGQAVLTYDHSLGQLGGYSVFQEMIPGQPTYEATVPLSGSDYKFYLAYYHFDGYRCGLALANPSLTSIAHITLTAVDNLGASLFTDRSIALAPGGHLSFDLAAQYPRLNNTRGNLYVTSDSGRLSAVGLRFAPGGSYTTLPIMNWTGMFP